MSPATRPQFKSRLRSGFRVHHLRKLVLLITMALAAATAAADAHVDATTMLISSGMKHVSTANATSLASIRAEASWPPPHWVEIDRVERNAEEAITTSIQEQKPVVVKNGSIVPISGWQDIDVLKKTMSNTKVLVKHSKRDSVAYFRAERNTGGHLFEPDEYVKESKVAFSEFIAEAEAAHEQRCSGVAGRCTNDTIDAGSSNVLYCQETFTNHPELEREFSGWDWTWVLKHCQRHGWGLPETNVLFMGSEGATTPAHFDEQHNFLNQVRGEKLVVLFPPGDYTRLYPFPVTHPCDRCSLVDVRSPDLERFPAFREARGHVTTLLPGDVLYIPYGWWHYCRTATHLAASITFWSQATSSGQTLVPENIGPNEWPRGRRNLEKMLADNVGGKQLGAEVLRLLGVIERGELDDPRLKDLRQMLDLLQVAKEDQLRFLVETFAGRFGFNQSAYV